MSLIPRWNLGTRLRGYAIIAAVLVVLFVAFGRGCGFEIVDTGHRGIQVRFGEVQGEPLPEGLYFYNPITTSIIELDVREQKRSGETASFTKDVQQVVVSYAINFRPDAAAIHLLYQGVGSDWSEKLLPQVIEGNLKNAIGQWDAVNLIENRAKAVRAAEAAITEAAAGRRIVVTRFEITNFDFSDEFEKAVEQKVTAEQEAARARNRTIQVQEEARQRLIAAEAEAKSMTIRAQALTQNKSLVEYEAVQKWDGKLPEFVMGNAVPFINVVPK
jgi:regulator of protease activity HflC (stomatin/prohibitin superfamily)